MQDNITSRPPVHYWTEAERLILAVAIRFYNCDSQQLLAIFNALQIERLRAEGFCTGLAHSSMVSQLADLRISSRGLEFRKVLSMNIEIARRVFRDQRDTIEAAALNLGIPLQLGPPPPNKSSTARKNPEDSPTSPSLPFPQLGSTRNEQAPSPRLRPRRQVLLSTTLHETFAQYIRSRDSSSDPTYCPSNANPSVSNSDSEYTAGEDSDTCPEDQPPCQSHDLDDSTPSGRVPALLKLGFDIRGRPRPKRPRLLFRAFDPAHGLCARRFLDTSAPVSGPFRGIRDLFRKHLSEDKTFSSPFLSWAESPKRAMKIICGSNPENSHLSLAVVDYNVLEEELERRFGRPTCIWLVPTICREFALEGLRKVHDSSAPLPRHNYTGRGEV